MCYRGEADLHKHVTGCKKNAGHKGFIPLKDFNASYLPSRYHDDELMSETIKTLAALTVQVQSKFTSLERPEFYPGTQVQHPNYIRRGSHGIRLGTGRVWGVTKYTESDRTCHCAKCQVSASPRIVWGQVHVVTATHVVFDDSEARQTSCVLGFDDNKSPGVSLDGWEVKRAHIEGDLGQLSYLTRDLELVDELDKLCRDFDDLCREGWDKYRRFVDVDKLTVIVSHPHGCSKQVSVGQWTHKCERDDLYTTYTRYWYTTCTCPGSAGAYVYRVGCNPRCCHHVHSGSNSEGNYSGVNFHLPLYRPVVCDVSKMRHAWCRPTLGFDDSQVVTSVSCMVELLELLEKMYWAEENKCWRHSLTDTLIVVVLHPHGCVEHVSLGQWPHKHEKEGWYTRNVYTSKYPGSSTACVYILGSDKLICLLQSEKPLTSCHLLLSQRILSTFLSRKCLLPLFTSSSITTPSDEKFFHTFDLKHKSLKCENESFQDFCNETCGSQGSEKSFGALTRHLNSNKSKHQDDYKAESVTLSIKASSHDLNVDQVNGNENLEIVGKLISTIGIKQVLGLHLRETSVYMLRSPSGRADHPKEVRGIPWKEFERETMRVASFADYPVDSPISASILASLGFVYIGEGKSQKVICFFCSLVKEKWEPVENVEEVHKLNSPNCPIVVVMETNNTASSSLSREISDTAAMFNNLGQNGNQPSYGAAPASSIGASAADMDVVDMITENNSRADSLGQGATGPADAAQPLHPNINSSIYSIPRVPLSVPPQPSAGNQNRAAASGNAAAGRDLNLQDLGIFHEKPKNPEYAILSKRIESFDGWPADCPVSSLDVARSGLHFLGYSDCGKCFFCGGALRNWTLGDDPFVEHARWYPKCSYIRQYKGQAFVDAVQEIKTADKNKKIITFEEVRQYMERSGAVILNQFDDTPVEYDAAVMSLIEEGYGAEDVYSAARSIRESGGTLRSDVILEKLLEGSRAEGATAAMPVLVDSKEDLKIIQDLKEQNSTLRNNLICKICMDKEVKIVFLPCGHLVSCQECAVAFHDCPVCRSHIRAYVRASIHNR
ncbi:uncharacterized protein LOC131929045 [Physella acuta]|uniref:uncharacterized protein LOC131929045 n=1 Tax=Physella acuta TaxID=109671 RepID=UPI0027DBE432|nr:uncharacterized protein LOC131929045 [Physella acuta]